MSPWKRRAAIAGGVVLVLAGVFAAGRYSAPVRVEERAVTRFVDRVVTAEVARTVQVAGPERVTERIVERPGAERVIERVIERGPVTTTTAAASSSERATSATAERTRVVEAARPRHALEVGARWPVEGARLRPERLEAGLGLRIVGPAWLAATADAPTEKLGDVRRYRFGLRLRVEF